MSTNTSLRIGVAQLSLSIGNIEGNKKQIAQAIANAKAQNANLLICPELAISGYHPQDLLLRKQFISDCVQAVHDIAALTYEGNLAILVGTPWVEDGKIYNAVLLLAEGKIQARSYKHHLPNYSHFTEKRYTSKGPTPAAITWKGVKYGILIGEDLWYDDSTLNFAAQGVDIILAISSSPFWVGKFEERLSLAYNKSSQFALPLIYVNAAYAQEELVLDGSSFVINDECQITKLLPRFSACLDYCDFTFTAHGLRNKALPIERLEITSDSETYHCLQFGLDDWMNNQEFERVLIMLDGSLASMVSTIIAVDSLGSGRVDAIFIPVTKAEREGFATLKKFADKLGVNLLYCPISTLVEEIEDKLSKKLGHSHTEEAFSVNTINYLRSLILTEKAKQTKALVLDTTNKTMLALGQTILPPITNSFSIVKDLWQSDLSNLVNWRNGNIPATAKFSRLDLIDANLLLNASHGELHLGEITISMTVADEVLKLLHEKNFSVSQITNKGYRQELVAMLAEAYFTGGMARKQSSYGIKVSQRDLGKDLHIPYYHHFHKGV